MMEMVQTFFLTHYSWHVLVRNWGDPQVLEGFTLSSIMIPILDGLGALKRPLFNKDAAAHAPIQCPSLPTFSLLGKSFETPCRLLINSIHRRIWALKQCFDIAVPAAILVILVITPFSPNEAEAQRWSLGVAYAGIECHCQRRSREPSSSFLK